MTTLFSDCADGTAQRMTLRRLAMIFGCVLLFVLSSAGAAQAAGIVVDDPGDSGGANCTLRSAVTAANTDTATGSCAAGSGADDITFHPTLAGATITLAGSQLNLTSTLTIDGGGVITVSGGNASRVFNITSSGVVTLTGLTIRDGYVPDNGGAILNTGGNVTLSASTVVSNSAASGGGIYNASSGRVTLAASAVVSNSAGSFGGGIHNLSGRVTLSASSVVANRATSGGGGGGGIYNSASSVISITNGSLVQSNSAAYGGGINNRSSSSVMLSASSIVSNSATDSGGGIHNGVSGVISMTAASLLLGNHASNLGGGIYNSGGGSVMLSASSAMSNRADNAGGGLYNTGSGSLISITAASLVQMNSAGGNGGGIFNVSGGSVTLSASSVLSNSANGGGGILNSGSGSAISMTAGSLVQGNRASSSGGGISNASSGSVTLAASSVVSNSAANGGGIHNDNSVISMTAGSLVEGNSAGFDGGGIYNRFGGSVTLAASSVVSNSATGASGDGGGIYNTGNGSIISITAASLVQMNSAGSNGGGIYNAISGTVTLAASSVVSNSATGANSDGGGIYNTGSGSVISMTNSSLVQSNSARSNGGGIYNASSGAVTLAASSVVSNSATSATSDGGGIYNTGSGSIISMTNSSLVLSNSARRNGGGIYNAISGTVTLAASSVVSNSAGSSGGGLYQAGGSSQVTASCIVNNSDTAVAYFGGTAPITATDNWWGHPSGPSGAGGGLGDSVSSNVDFGGALGAAILGCPTLTFFDLAIAKTVDPAAAAPGEAVTYTLIFTNAGTDVAGAATISDSIPLSVTITGVTSSTFGGSVFITQTGAAPDFAWEVSDLPASAGGIITLTGTVNPNAGLIGAAITNTATITTSSDIIPTNNSSAAAFILGEGVCSATPDAGATVFTSADASAVQAAIDAASPGATVKIAGTCVGVQPRAYAPVGVAGVYSQTGYISKTLTVMGGFTTANWSSSDPVANPTVLDGDASGQVLVIDAPGLAVAVLNLKVTNGYAGPGPDIDEGAGITIYTATVTISNTQVYSNYAEGEGGGLSVIDGVVAIVDSAFHHNSAVCSGGAIENFDSHMTIANSHIYTNTADCEGGGLTNISANATAWMTITNGTRIEENSAQEGGGLYNEDGVVVIDASTVAANLADAGGGVANYGSGFGMDPVLIIRNGAAIVDNDAVIYGGGIYNEDGDVTIDASHVLSNTACCVGGGGVFVLATYAATLTVQNGSTINYNSTEGAGGAIYSAYAAVTVDNAEVAWNQAAEGGGVYQDSCDCIESGIVITNGTVIKHNHAIDDGSQFYGEGGGIFNAAGWVQVANSLVYSNTADQDGGGISSLDYLTITNSYIGANLSVYNDGGGVDADGPTWIYNSTIADNLAGEDGGGLDSDWDTYIENSLIIRNTAGISPSLDAADGGGIHHFDGALVITGTQILSNSAPVAGGGIYVDWEITVTNSLVQGNRADLGGGVFVDWEAIATLDGVQVVSNTGVITGGGVFLDTGLLTVTHSTIAENAAGGEGGGFYSTGAANTLAISATRILSNTAGNGGALFQADGATTVNGSCIVANSDVAVYYGGGVTPPLDAKSNWWGHPTGPSGAGPGLGDSTSDNVDFDEFLGAAILDCPAFTFPDLAIAKATAPYVLRGGVVTYTLAFSNSGDGPAVNVVISDSIPLSITVTGVTGSTTGGVLVQTSAAPDLAWALAELPAGAQGVITVTGVLDAAAPAGLTITNTATITASGVVTPGVHSSDAAFTVVQMNVFPAQPGVAPGGSVTISATVRPAIPGLTVNFSMISGTPGLSSPTATDANGVATVQYTAGGSAEVVQVEGALAVAPAVRDRGILYVAVATVAGEIATAAGDPFTAGNLAPNHIVITKTGAGAPPVGWAEFGGNPCPDAAPGSRIVSPYVDVMVDDATDVTEIVVTLKYTATAEATQHRLYWCNLGVWQQVAGTVTVDEVTATLVFTVNNATTPAIFQLAGTPFVGVGAKPTAATVGDFVAAQAADRVQLTWTTVNEAGLTGFHLYRGLDAAGPGERITGAPVPAQGAGGLEGFAYTYDDFTPRPPETAFYYWLEEVHGSGELFRHGPLRVGGAGGLRIFLPAISQGSAVAAAEPLPAASEAEPAPAEPASAEDSAGAAAPAAPADPLPAEQTGDPAAAGEVMRLHYLPMLFGESE